MSTYRIGRKILIIMKNKNMVHSLQIFRVLPLIFLIFIFFFLFWDVSPESFCEEHIQQDSHNRDTTGVKMLSRESKLIVGGDTI